MSTDFTHVIMTRFNMATPGREFSIRTQPGWLERRFELFERYCLPSISAQTAQNFHWIIYFDEETPEIFKSRIENLRKAFPFIPYYTQLFSAEGWPRSIRESVAPQTPLILSTRLDNDDALSCDFVARLHDAVWAHNTAKGAYNFTNGLIRRDTALYALRHHSNPFFSWLEMNGAKMRMAPSIQHMKIHQHGPVYQIDGPPTWMQIVHETNVSNKVRGWRVCPDDVRERFPSALSDGLCPVSNFAWASDRLVSYPLRRLRDAAITFWNG